MSKNDQPDSNATALAFNSILLIEKLSFTADFLPPNGVFAKIVPFTTHVDEKPTPPPAVDPKYEPQPKIESK